MHAYEDGKVIGTFKYSFNKILWIHYDEKYTANWREKELDLTRAMQGFVFSLKGGPSHQIHKLSRYLLCK